MRTISPAKISVVTDYALRFTEEESDILVECGKTKQGVRDLFENLRQRYPNHFRGAIIHSEEQFKENIKKTGNILSKYFPKNKLLWAVKSAPFKELAAAALEAGANLEVGSFEELSLALAAGAGREKIYHTSPAKFDWDIDKIVESGCTTISDNLTELVLINDKAGAANKTISAAIRINPMVQTRTQGIYSTGNINCKFGLPNISAEFLKQIKGLKNINLNMIHMHIGSQVSNSENYTMAVKNLIKIYELFIECGFNIETMDIGGGFPYPYSVCPELNEGKGDQAFFNYIEESFEDYISKIAAVFRKNMGTDMPAIAIEPGQHLIAGTAFALGYVLNVKKYPSGLQWIMSSVNVNDLWHKTLSPEIYFDIHILKDGDDKLVPSGVGSTLCYSGDILTPWEVAVNLPEKTEREDPILIKNTGAYSRLGAGNFHNMLRLPVLMIDKDGNLKEICPQN